MGLFSFFKRRKPNVPPAVRGSKGGAKISGDELQDFLDNEQLLFVTSSNVAAAQYFGETRELMVEYLDGAAWIYGDISLAEAEAFARAPSKGTWIWDVVKVRGTVHDHKKPAKQLK
jgi:hypothetical protein